MTLAFGTDRLCRFCGGETYTRHGDSCMACEGTGLEPPQHAATRRSDPETSREAAASISSERLRASQQYILFILQQDGPLTDEGIWERLSDELSIGVISPSGARTRRSELVDKGLVYDTGKRETLASGRKAVVWGAR